MRQYPSFLIAVTVTVALGFAQTAKRTFIQAELENPIKTKKTKPGDKVKARMTTLAILPDGSTLSAATEIDGHVTEVHADEAGKSSVSITFDGIEIQNNKKTPALLAIRAAMMPGGPATSAKDPGALAPGEVPHGRPMAGRPQSVQDAVEMESKAATVPSSSSPPATHGMVAAQSGSVIGLPGVELHFDENGKEPSMFVSSSPNLELKPGLQLMLFVVTPPAK